MRTMISLSNETSTNKLEVVRSSISISQRFEISGDAINKTFRNYKTAVEETVKDNLSLLDELPPLKNLSIEELKEHFKKMLEDDLKKDLVFEKSVEIQRYANDIWTYVDSYFREIFEYHNSVRREVDSKIFDVCRMFFNSDMPLCFLKTMENALLIQKDYLDVYDRRIRKERLNLLVSRNNRRKFEKLCENHNRWVMPFTERLDKIERTWIKLFWYVDFSNSAAVNDIFRVKTIKSSNIDMKVVQEFISDLQKQTQEIERLIEPMIEFRLFTSYEDNSGARTIRKVMELLNITEG